MDKVALLHDDVIDPKQAFGMPTLPLMDRASQQRRRSERRRRSSVGQRARHRTRQSVGEILKSRDAAQDRAAQVRLDEMHDFSPYGRKNHRAPALPTTWAN
jgi:hypothetical protein